MDTTFADIVAHWAGHQTECGLSVDWADAHELCWRCAQKRNLQRCHIVPRALGGTELPENLVLLCGQCHAEAPNVSDPEFMWVWLRAHAASYYGIYWQVRGIREYELIYGEKPFVGLQHSEALMQQVSALSQELFQNTNTHWGQGKLNPSTWAWVFRQIDQKARQDA